MSFTIRPAREQAFVNREEELSDMLSINDLSSSEQMRNTLNGEISNVGQYLIYLVDKGVLDEGDGVYGFTDPIFKMWLKRN